MPSEWSRLFEFNTDAVYSSVNKTYIGGGNPAVVYGPPPSPPW